MKLKGAKQMLRLVKASSGSRTPPTEFRIWAYGQVRTSKGDALLTRAAARKILADRAQQDADVMIDWEHEALDEGITGPRVAAGWCNLEARADGLWAVNVRWTPKAAEVLSTAEYRYFSPAYFVDKRTREITALINIALTNIPATKNIRPLVAAGRMTKPNAATTVTRNAKMKNFGAKLSQHMKDEALSPNAMAEKCGISIDRMRKLTAGEEPTPEEMKACAKAMGLEEETTSAEDNVDSEDMDTEQEENPEPDTADEDQGGETPDEDDSEEEGGKESLKASRDLVAELMSITGTKSPTKMRGVLAAMKAKAGMYDQDHKMLVQMKKEREESKRTALIKAGKDERKLTPALIRHFAKRPVDEFEAFLEAAPILGGELHQVEPQKELARLSREDRMVAELLNRDPKRTAKFLEDEESGTNASLILATYTAQQG